MSQKQSKIRAYFFLLLPAILLAVISPVGAGVAHAGWTLGSLFGKLSDAIANILVQVVRFLIYESSVLVLRGAAFIFDSVVPYSLGIGGTTSVFQSAFITEGWGLMRDITNMVFIFAMLYIAIATILQVGAGRNTKALIINIILIALFVNFSLFLAQVVIDAANLLALEFYYALTSASTHGLAAVFIVGFNPQSLLGTTGFDAWISGGSNLSVLFFVYLFGGIVQLIAAYMILLASFLFIGRIVVLWILMIVSPIAFAAYIIPKFAGKFTEWWDRLLKQAFVAPIFLFFFYIFALFVQPGGGLSVFIRQASQAASAGDALFDVILKIALGFSLVVAFLMISLKMTKSLSGEVAGFATKAAGFTIGAAAAAVTGPVGAARLAKLAGTFGVPTAGMGAGAAVGRVAGTPLAPIRTVVGEAVGGTVMGAKEKIAAGGRATAGAAAKKVVEAGTKQGLGGALLRTFGIARGAARVEAEAKAGAKAAVEKAEKDLDALSNEALQTEYGSALSSPEKRAAIIKILGKRGKLKPDEKGERLIDPESVKETLKTVKGRGYDTEKEVDDKYLWQYAQTDEERVKAIRKLSPENIKKLGNDYFDFEEKPEMLSLLLKNLKPAQVTALFELEREKKKQVGADGKPVKNEKGEDVYEQKKKLDANGNPVKNEKGEDVNEDVYTDTNGDKFFKAVADEMKKLNTTIEKYLESENVKNMPLAQTFRGKTGRNLAETYGIPLEEPKKKKGKKGGVEDEDDEEDEDEDSKKKKDKKDGEADEAGEKDEEKTTESESKEKDA